MPNEAAAFWNARYQADAYMYGTAPNEFLAAHASFLPAKGRILCVAEGEGRNSVHLAAQGHNVAAFDLSAAGKKKAERLAADQGVCLQYDVCTVQDYAFGTAVWDGIVSIFAHTDAPTRADTLKKARQGLKPGGVFLLEAYHPKQISDGYGTGGPSDPSWLVTCAELQQAFAGFEIIHCTEAARTVHEGIAHTGQAFVSQFIARKPG